MEVPQPTQPPTTIHKNQFSSKSSDNGSTLIHLWNPYHDESQIFGEEQDLQFMGQENNILKRQEWVYEHSHSQISQNEIRDCFEKAEQFEDFHQKGAQQNLMRGGQQKEQQHFDIPHLNIGVYLQEENLNLEIQQQATDQGKPENQLQTQSKCKNASKNIIKNFGRDLLNYMIECKNHQNQHGSHELFPAGESSQGYSQSIAKITKIKKKINGISHLKQLWTDEKEGALFRKISENYLRKRSFKYIFGSRVKAYKEHLQFKEILRKNLRSPQNFTHLITKYF